MSVFPFLRGKRTWFNTEQGYGIISVILHGVSALLVFGLFALGFWMVTLSYYDPWYKQAPFYHKSIGVLFFVLLINPSSSVGAYRYTPLFTNRYPANHSKREPYRPL